MPSVVAADDTDMESKNRRIKTNKLILKLKAKNEGVFTNWSHIFIDKSFSVHSHHA